MHKAALFSLSNKTGAVELARALRAVSVVIYATAGTLAFLVEHGVEAHDVGELTGFPSLFDGRVKTLHPKIFGGILADRNDEHHVAQSERYRIPDISTVVVNLYPFEQTVARPGVNAAEAIEQIDVGGVALLRAAAKNFEHVTVLSDPAQYDTFVRGLPDALDAATRRRLGIAAFERTAQYDAAIAHYLEGKGEVLPADLPGSLTLTLPLATPLRYGENPQSRAAFYLGHRERLPEQLWGKGLSYNNLLDVDATLRLLARLKDGAGEGRTQQPAFRAAVVKHTVPCGVAQRSSVAAAVHEALVADPVSAFGGIVAVDGKLDVPSARALAEFFLEIVAAPEYDREALECLQKKKSLRILRYAKELPEQLAREVRLRSALGGVLADEEDPKAPPETWHVVSQRQPSQPQWEDLAFAWDVVRHVKSNGVVLVRDGVTVGICAGQTNRVSAVRIAGVRARERAHDAACASDGFFPFADGLQEAAKAGCSAIIAPRGSIRDAQVIQAADDANIALVFSTYRYFLH
ncbi:MAG: bifunctional phosphoribosylaminoimidazolecarboxamide formyltransferase/IMP cyclohydrolase [Candidatus Eremiobacteraeota bacterium]|nr:bifunctional phosphoribosylaminoimidazolecarboxamide formyltransferase/IMP cyclohydrolase [Candidatus Eremiobacteraeota bacterium]